MTTQKQEIERFLNAVAELAERQDYFQFQLVAAASSGDEIAIIAYRDREDGPLLGRFLDYKELSQEFKGASPEQIADAIVVNELADPSGPGATRAYDWESSFTGIDEAVSWLNFPAIHPDHIQPLTFKAGS